MGARLVSAVLSLSFITCRALTGSHESWCSLAYRHRHENTAARVWVAVFGPRHCEASWRRYWG